jgi:hypothetical protein
LEVIRGEDKGGEKMAEKKFNRVYVPRRYYKIVPERAKTTIFRQQQKTGLMIGRRLVPKQQSDRTRVMRMTMPFDVNKDGKINQMDLQRGQIIGRVSHSQKIPNKRIVIKRHYRQGRPVRSYGRRR